MPQRDATYIGLRGPQLPFGHGGPTVVGVREAASQRTLLKPPEAHMLAEGFEWGYEGSGPGALAEAILADRLGFTPDPSVSMTFEHDLVSRLPSEFELSGTEVDDWVSRRLADAVSTSAAHSRAG